MFKSAFPILPTPDMNLALGFYQDLLGGKVSYRFPPDDEAAYVGVTLGPSHIGIGLDRDVRAGGDDQRISLWVYADDCDAAVERLRSAGVSTAKEPADQPWGERAAWVQDPDGNQVMIGSGPGS